MTVTPEMTAAAEAYLRERGFTVPWWGNGPAPAEFIEFVSGFFETMRALEPVPVPPIGHEEMLGRIRAVTDALRAGREVLTGQHADARPNDATEPPSTPTKPA